MLTSKNHFREYCFCTILDKEQVPGPLIDILYMQPNTRPQCHAAPPLYHNDVIYNTAHAMTVQVLTSVSSIIFFDTKTV